jgi:hypothetical protein
MGSASTGFEEKLAQGVSKDGDIAPGIVLKAVDKNGLLSNSAL